MATSDKWKNVDIKLNCKSPCVLSWYTNYVIYRWRKVLHNRSTSVIESFGNIQLVLNFQETWKTSRFVILIFWPLPRSRHKQIGKFVISSYYYIYILTMINTYIKLRVYLSIINEKLSVHVAFIYSSLEELFLSSIWLKLFSPPESHF